MIQLFNLIMPSPQNNKKHIDYYAVVQFLLTMNLFSADANIDGMNQDLVIQEHHMKNVAFYVQILNWEAIYNNIQISHFFWLTRIYFYCQMSNIPFWFFDIYNVVTKIMTRVELVTYLSRMCWVTSDLQIRLILTSLTLYRKHFLDYAQKNTMNLVKAIFFNPNQIISNCIQIWIQCIKKRHHLGHYVILKLQENVKRKKFEKKSLELCHLVVKKWISFYQWKKQIKYRYSKGLISFLHKLKSKKLKFETETRIEILNDTWTHSYLTLIMNHKNRIVKPIIIKWKQLLLNRKRRRLLLHHVIQKWKHNIVIPCRIHNIKLERRMIHFLSRILVLCVPKFNSIIITKAYSKECKLFLCAIDNVVSVATIDALKKACNIISLSSFYKMHKENFSDPRFASKLAPFSSVNRLLADLKTCVERLIKHLNLISDYVPKPHLEAYSKTILTTFYNLDIYHILRWWRNFNAPKYMTFILDAIGIEKTRQWLAKNNDESTTLAKKFESILPRTAVCLVTTHSMKHIVENGSVEIFQKDLRGFYNSNAQLVYDHGLQHVQIVSAEKIRGDSTITSVSRDALATDAILAFLRSKLENKKTTDDDDQKLNVKNKKKKRRKSTLQEQIASACDLATHQPEEEARNQIQGENNFLSPILLPILSPILSPSLSPKIYSV
jgi:hypothetical protein